MKIATRIGIVLIFAFSIASNALSIELASEYSPSFFKSRKAAIDPDEAAYGVPFGANESEVLKQIGLPNGIIRVSSSRKVFIYGKSHAFVFRKGVFRELRVSHSMIDWQLSKQMENHPFFDRGDWTISPGIKSNMSYDEVMLSLGQAGGIGDHRFAFDTENATVNLSFSSRTSAGSSPKYQLFGFHIIHYGN